MNIFDQCIAMERDSLIFVSATRQLATKDLPELAMQYGGLLQNVHGKRVAVAIRNISTLAEALILLDGICIQLLLLPSDADKNQTSHFIEVSKTEILLTDILDFDNLSCETVYFSVNAATPPTREHKTRWILPTSGTTGTPKLIPHTLESLSRSVKRESKKGQGLRWGLLYEMTRFAGLQVYLQAVLGGSTLVLPDKSVLSFENQIIFFAEQGVNALSATPTMWRKILMTTAAKNLNLKLITLGGEIATQDILDALGSNFPTAKITHIYASTEFGVGFSVADCKEGFPAAWLDDPTKFFTIEESTGELLFSDKTEENCQKLGTGDMISIQGDRALFLGRINGSINVGGNKVMPEEVERVLLDYPGVMLASVTAKKNPIMGNLVQAYIVLSPNLTSDTSLKKSLLNHCRSYLAPFKVPAIINFVDSINISASGKIKRD